MTQTLTKNTSWKNMNVKKKGLLEFHDGTILHSRCSFSRTSHFVLHQKAPSFKTNVVHQFASRVNQFFTYFYLFIYLYFFLRVDLSQCFHGTKKLYFQ